MSKVPGYPESIAQSASSDGRTIENSTTDRSHLQIVLLVESTSDLSPYIYHINDQPFNNRYHVLNDKLILRSLPRTEPQSEAIKSDLESGDASSSKESYKTIKERNPEMEHAQALVSAIKVELSRIENTLRLNTAASNVTVSSLVKRGKVHIDDRPKSAVSKETFVLITTMYNPYLPKLLIEAGVSIRAIVRLINEEKNNQQFGFAKFYNDYLKEYPFRSKLKRSTPKKRGHCREPTEKLAEVIDSFWTRLASVRTENPITFRDTIFVDSVLPTVDLNGEHDRFHEVLELYRIALHEDIRSVQMKIRKIEQSHQCYLNGKVVQRMRSLKHSSIDELTIYKLSILTRGSNVPCVLEAVVNQVVSKSADLADESVEIYYQLTSFLLNMTNQLDNYYVLKDPVNRGNIVNSRDQARLSFLLKQTKESTFHTSVDLLHTFAKDLTKDYFKFHNPFVEQMKHVFNEKLLDPAIKTCESKIRARYIKKNPAKVLINKKFYLSYYLSLSVLKSTSKKRLHSIGNQSLIDSIENIIDTNLSTALAQDKRTSKTACIETDDKELGEKIKNMIDIKFSTVLQHGKRNSETAKMEMDKKSSDNQQLNEQMNSIPEVSNINTDKNIPSSQQVEMKNTDENIQEDLQQTGESRCIVKMNKTLAELAEEFQNHNIAIESLRTVYNSTENLAPNTLVQIFFYRFLSADRVSFTCLPVTDDLLVQFWNETHSETEWTFEIPSVLGLHDFYHHVLESMSDTELSGVIVCPKSETSISEVSSDICLTDPTIVDLFLLPDSIKYERLINKSKSSQVISEGIEEYESSVDDFSSNEELKLSINPLSYKYGIPQLIENKGSLLTHRFGENIKISIEKNTWTNKNVKNITLGFHVKAVRNGFRESKDHLVYFHIRIDLLEDHVTFEDFHIRLNTNTEIRFKKNQLSSTDTSLNHLSEASDESGRNFEDEIRNVLVQNSLDESIEPDDVIYDQGIILFNKFIKVSPRYYPLMTNENGITIQITNETAFPFCILQYRTEKQNFPNSVRKYFLNASVLIWEKSSEEFKVMTGTGETFLMTKKSSESSSSQLVGVGNDSCKFVSPDGHIYEIQNGVRTLQEESMAVTGPKDFNENSLTFTREDGLRMFYCEDGTLHTVHPDGTRFITVVMETNEMGDVELEEFILVNIKVEIIHKDYLPVIYNFQESHIEIRDPNGLCLKLSPDGSFKFTSDAVSSITTGSEYVLWETFDQLSGEATEKLEFRLSDESSDTTIATLTNDQEKIFVDSRGNMQSCSTSDVCENESFEDELSSNSHHSLNSGLTDSNSELSGLLVLSSDLSGFEILPNNLVELIMTLVKLDQKQNDTIVTQELDTLYPYYSTLISYPLPQVSSGADSLPFSEMQNNSVFCKKVHTLPSTYDADWSHPFHPKQDAPCPLSTQDVAYRLFHCVNKGSKEIIELHLQAVDQLDRNGHVEFDSRVDYDDAGIAERICRGSVSLRRLREDEISFLRSLFERMLNGAFLVANVSWVTGENRRLLEILKSRSKEVKVGVTDEAFDVARCKKERPKCFVKKKDQKRRC